jgi:biopolymer transport protein ExbB
MVRIRGFIKKKDISGAVSYCMEEKSPIANVVRKGLKKYKLGHERVKESIENAGNQEISKLEKGLPILASVSGIAPLLGFLGTVTGMISAFMTIQDLLVSPRILPRYLGSTITTAFGLFVEFLRLHFTIISSAVKN